MGRRERDKLSRGYFYQVLIRRLYSWFLVSCFVLFFLSFFFQVFIVLGFPKKTKKKKRQQVSEKVSTQSAQSRTFVLVLRGQAGYETNPREKELFVQLIL